MPSDFSFEEVVKAYKATGSVWKAAKRLGLCGQSVHERLVNNGYKLPGRIWTEEEYKELRLLVGQCPIAEIARRLGRPYGSVAEKISDLGLAGKTRRSNKPISLRGTGLNKETMKRHAIDLLNYDGKITPFCRQRGFSVDVFVKAMQKYRPEVWLEFSKRTDLEPQRCGYCDGEFYPQNKKQKTCSRKCQADLRSDKQYFNNQKRLTIGLSEGICQLCEQPKKILASHHVWGKDNDPDADWLVALCRGCHRLVEQLAARNTTSNAGFYERAIIWAYLKKNGKHRLMGLNVYVDIEQDG